MEQNNIQMDSQQEIITPSVEKKERHVTLIVLIVLLAIIILLGSSFFIFFHKPHISQVKNNSSARLTTIKFIVPTGIVEEVTNKTTIASSLDVPPLYPNAPWEDITASESLKKDGINQASVVTKEYDYIPIFFKKGKYWKVKTPIKYDLIGKYYFDGLQKEGWDTQVIFNEFKLHAFAADAPCQGGTGMVGYKDGMVKTVIISHVLLPCSLPQSPDDTPYPSDFVFNANYMIFISDPMPLNDIAASIKNR